MAESTLPKLAFPNGMGVGYAISSNTIYFCPDNNWIEI